MNCCVYVDLRLLGRCTAEIGHSLEATVELKLISV